ncbi:MAG: citramalate synthase [Dehalococcoidia bacterium]|nr:citramalate synthase [Dehalococcoidia bacterium]
MTDVLLYDCTLRDGAQMEGISLSVEDKIKITRKLDEIGVHYIEGGWPGSNPKDVEFFERARSLRLDKAKLAAFGSTRRAGVTPAEDANLKALLDAETPVVTLVGKASQRQVRDVLRIDNEENLAMIRDSVAFMKKEGREVVFDAEHFFDGFLDNPDYALACARVAADAGADCITLCDTNGGRTTEQIVEAVRAVQAKVSCDLGIHVHNDADLAVANTLAAVSAGVRYVQGCVNGYGERCGNANLTSIIANLKLKQGIDCVSDDELSRLTEASLYISEVANLTPNPHAPYVGHSAFAHKGGLHVDATLKLSDAYQHVPPEAVGNNRRVLVSELAGQRNISAKLEEAGVDLALSRDETRALLETVKLLESRGYTYEGAEASFELLARRSRAEYRRPFELVDFMVIVRKHTDPDRDLEGGEMLAEAAVKVRVDGQVKHTVAEGDGPVNALDAAVRKALVEFYESLAEVRLVDYKVRIVDSSTGTGATVRVMIESTDGEREWTTVGCSPNIIEASWLALADSLEYWLVRRLEAAA